MPMPGNRSDRTDEAPRDAAQSAAGTPPALIHTFLERYRISLSALAVELRLSDETVADYAQYGAPNWFRFALTGVAINRGIPPANLTWLAADPRRPEDGRADASGNYDASDAAGGAGSVDWVVDGTMGA